VRIAAASKMRGEICPMSNCVFDRVGVGTKLLVRHGGRREPQQVGHRWLLIEPSKSNSVRAGFRPEIGAGMSR